jgi:hypothetical protein
MNNLACSYRDGMVYQKMWKLLFIFFFNLQSWKILVQFVV